MRDIHADTPAPTAHPLTAPPATRPTREELAQLTRAELLAQPGWSPEKIEQDPPDGRGETAPDEE